MKNIYLTYFTLLVLACYSCSSGRVSQNSASAKDSTGITFNKSGINRSVPPPVNRNLPQSSLGMGSAAIVSEEKIMPDNSTPVENIANQSLAEAWRNQIMSTDKFLLQAYQSGLAEIEIAKEIQKKTKNALILNYANKMIVDYTLANNNLQKFASSRNISLSKSSTTSTLSDHNEDIERKYLKLSMDDHQAKIAIYEKITTGNDEEVKSFANTQLPILKAHLKEVLELYQKK
ncbi:hypothetical protein A5893_03360 [Pedobacter psychrophilus]|uniref:DUF4142 domain-containing protein n=1 Tax=Pedobacter psychrophilus TaxID=1826909 RepID=A0A179DM88_9SPHI|nr:DUF4142 domain-containing protein [Pedobacter psychrophilus]OAQ42167.1 hypothetical protein A5893_03360 [Pedobacter psychrophilus]